MSGFVLGLTKTAVEGTLSRVQRAIEEEAQIKEKVQHDLRVPDDAVLPQHRHQRARQERGCEGLRCGGLRGQEQVGVVVAHAAVLYGASTTPGRG